MNFGLWVLTFTTSFDKQTKSKCHFSFSCCIFFRLPQVNHIDIAPNFAGTLMGLTNAAANVMSIIAPLLVGFIVKDETDPVEWRMVFFISAGVYFFGNLMFVLFSSTEIQVWNDPDHRDRRKIFFWFSYSSSFIGFFIFILIKINSIE